MVLPAVVVALLQRAILHFDNAFKFIQRIDKLVATISQAVAGLINLGDDDIALMVAQQGFAALIIDVLQAFVEQRQDKI